MIRNQVDNVEDNVAAIHLSHDCLFTRDASNASDPIIGS